MITEKTPFLFLIILMVQFIGLNNEVDGKGIKFYLGTESMPDLNGVPYDPLKNEATLFTDAYN